MNEFFKELSKAIMLFASMFTILIFFQKANWFFGFYILAIFYFISYAIYYVANYNQKREELENDR